MHIGVISDTHDNIWRLEQVLVQLQEVDLAIHCGDLCAPFMVKRLGGDKGPDPYCLGQ